MHKTLALALVAIATGLPSIVVAEDARSILKTAYEKQLARWDGVDLYAVEQTIMGNEAKSYFRRTTVTDSAGDSQVMFLTVPSHVVESGDCIRSQTLTPDELERFAASAEMTGSAAGSGIEDGLEDAGLPRGLLSASGSSPNATFDPRVMMGANAEFLRGAADAQRQNAAEAAGPDGTDQADQMARFIRNARLIGVESIDGRNAYHLQSKDLGPAQQIDGGEYKMDTMSIWFDTEHYVSLRMKMDGTLTSEGETRPMTIENIQTDYRVVPGSNLYEPYQQITRMSGMMDSSQQAELREAEKQLAELEQQMASMPASQRRMMEQMMGPQLEMIRNMASGGGFQTEIVTNAIMVNPPMTGQDGKNCPSVPMNEKDLGMVRDIQANLATLGYYTGAADGVLNKQTAIAISKFESANGLKVTGRPSPQLSQHIEAQLSGLSKADLSPDYLAGDWCTDVVQERSLYTFATDGSYRVGVVGITITQMDGINYLPETYDHERFFEKVEHVGTKSDNRFSVIKKGGSELAFTRGNCFK